METIIGFLLIPWVFISILTVVFLVQLALVENEYFGWTTTSFLIVITLLHLKYDLWGTIVDNPLYFFLYLAGYLAAGVGWSILKWYNQVKKTTRKLNKIKNKYIEDTRSDENLWEHLKRELSLYHVTNKETTNIAVKKWVKEQNDTRIIIAWISYWPISLVSTLINDPIRRLVIEIYHRINKIYDKILDHIIKTDVKDI